MRTSLAPPRLTLPLTDPPLPARGRGACNTACPVPRRGHDPALPAAPPQRPQAHRAARPRAGRRLRLDEGRRLAAGAARPVQGEGGGARASGRRERLRRRGAGRYGDAAGAAVRGDEGADQGGRRLGARRRWAVRVLQPLRDRRAASASPAPTPRRRERRRIAAARRGRARQRACVLFGRGGRALARPCALRLGRGRTGFGVLPHPRQGPGQRRDAARRDRQRLRRPDLLARQRLALLGLARRERAAVQGLPPAGARRPQWRRGGRADLRGAGRGHVHRRRRHRRPQPHPDLGPQSGHQRILADPGRRSHRRADRGRTAARRASDTASAVGTATGPSAPTTTARSTSS